MFSCHDVYYKTLMLPFLFFAFCGFFFFQGSGSLTWYWWPCVATYSTHGGRSSWQWGLAESQGQNWVYGMTCPKLLSYWISSWFNITKLWLWYLWFFQTPPGRRKKGLKNRVKHVYLTGLLGLQGQCVGKSTRADSRTLGRKLMSGIFSAKNLWKDGNQLYTGEKFQVVIHLRITSCFMDPWIQMIRCWHAGKRMPPST